MCGTDEDAFTKILVNRSVPHLRKVFDQYKAYAEKDIEESIESEFSGDTKKTLMAIGKSRQETISIFKKSDCMPSCH